jgi:hypothetical protein
LFPVATCGVDFRNAECLRCHSHRYSGMDGDSTDLWICRRKNMGPSGERGHVFGAIAPRAMCLLLTPFE